MVFGVNLLTYDKKQIDIGIEAGGTKNSKLTRSSINNNSKIGILHGAAQYCIQG